MVLYIKNLQHDFSNIATLRVNNKELLTPSDKANALNDHFVSVFTRENSNILKLPMNQYPILQDIFSTIGIKCILEKLDTSKSAGPDDISSCVLKLWYSSDVTLRSHASNLLTLSSNLLELV